MSQYLEFNPDFDETADDGEQVADHEENIPAVDELHSVTPAHTTPKSVIKVLHILLDRKMRDYQQDEIK